MVKSIPEIINPTQQTLTTQTNFSLQKGRRILLDSAVLHEIKSLPGSTGLITRVPLPISSSPVPSPCFYFAKFAERDADNDGGGASGAESTVLSQSIWRAFSSLYKI